MAAILYINIRNKLSLRRAQTAHIVFKLKSILLSHRLINIAKSAIDLRTRHFSAPCQICCMSHCARPGQARPVINHTAKAPKENYLKRHYNKFKAIWNLGLHRIPKKSSAKKEKEKKKKVEYKTSAEADVERRGEKNKCFGHFIMRIIHCCNGLSLCRSPNPAALPAISSPLTLPKGLLRKNA